jgi:hypothetical protein
MITAPGNDAEMLWKVRQMDRQNLEMKRLGMAFGGPTKASCLGQRLRTHGRPYHLPILGLYPSRAIAEALLRRDGFLANKSSQQVPQ